MSETIDALLAPFPRTSFLTWSTPVEPLSRLGKHLEIDLRVKRDDLTGLAFGGNKVRKLEFYFGQALKEGADTVLITGAVQSNYVRVVAACAARLGLECHVQLEERVSGQDDTYRSSGNVLLDDLLGAHRYAFDVGEDEEGADARLHDIAAGLSQRGRRPYVIPLSPKHPPLGSLGYLACAAELMRQGALDVDQIVVPSGSGLTHSGLLFGLRALGWKGRVIGICVRRSASAQAERLARHIDRIATLVGTSSPVKDGDIEVFDDVLSPGYGQLNDAVSYALRLAARLEGLLVDPVYTARALAGLIACSGDGRIPKRSRTLFLHTGGLPALFAYERDLRAQLGRATPHPTGHR
ncbi:1-aminocyclopropane-1-carboxylate deaminase [alpha proteobacterium BAL199]|nr:1-aminocyclopropane-1-carboxylate deaminase [alpha proteobacterium BAL199]